MWEHVGNIKGPPGDVTTIVSRGNFFFQGRNEDGIEVAKIAGYWKAKFDGQIEGWDITVDAGSISIRIWKIANGNTAPTSANAIATLVFAIAGDTSHESVDVSMFSTVDVAEGDIFAAEVLAVGGGIKDFGGSVWIRKLGDEVSGGGGGVNLITNETPSEPINGINTSFTTDFPFSDLDVYLNGLRQRLSIDYTITSPTSFTMTTPPSTGDTLTVDYLT